MTKRLLTLTLSLMLLCVSALAQGNGYNAARQATFVTAGSDITLQQNSLIAYHEIIWTPNASVATCTASVDSSVDGITWTTGGIITSKNCASPGNTGIPSAAVQANYVRLTILTLTGTNASVTIQYEGWAYAPGGGSFSYSWFGNTMNPLTALVDPTSAVDTAGNGITWNSSFLEAGDFVGDNCAFFGAAPTGVLCVDSAGDSIGMSPVAQFLASAPGSGFIQLNATTYLDRNATSVSSPFPTPPANTTFDVINTSGSPTRHAVTSFGSTAFLSTVAYGGTYTTPTALTAGSQIGGINAWAYDGTALGGPIASFRTFANQDQAVGAHGSYADIATTPDGSTTQAEVLKFENDGGITVPGVTGGDQGAGTANLKGVFVNGVAALTSIPLPALVGSAFNTTQYTNATTGLTTVVTSPSIAAGWLVYVDCQGTYSITGTAEKIGIALTASQTAQDMDYGAFINYSAAAGVGSVGFTGTSTTGGTAISGGGVVGSTGAVYAFRISGRILWNASNAGTVALQAETGNALGTVTINAYNASCLFTRLQ